ncbi:MAG TPA: hypothetical protein VGX92_07200 [Pyrinomonadaceae bacterium]|jgi:CII-binding regulator of phage lambda lysogenization HflD|nr:hypothetical protein [Pyrinomonadaceae bacterium]
MGLPAIESETGASASIIKVQSIAFTGQSEDAAFIIMMKAASSTNAYF